MKNKIITIDKKDMIIVFDKNRRYATLLLMIKVNVYIDSKRKEIKKDIKENYRGYRLESARLALFWTLSYTK